MVAVISWCTLDGCCYFRVYSGWLLLFPGGLWMVAVISWSSHDRGHRQSMKSDNADIGNLAMERTLELWVFAMCPALRGSTVSYAGDAHFPKHSLEYSLNF